MLGDSTRILVVEHRSPGLTGTLVGLAARGWDMQVVTSIQEATEALQGARFDVVLAAESLPDGMGYDLAGTVARRSATLWVGVPLSESCLWLPVVERGAQVLGQRALNGRVIEGELQALLDSCHPQVVASRPDIASSLR